ncbi:MAG: hypothetical protein QOI14_1250 [Actinomycetota bacterium]|nr:hypothetical protein [Actinomycetota bacterium]
MVGASAQPDAWGPTRTPRLLGWVAVCNFVTVGSATYLTSGHTLALHILAWIVALAVGVAAALGLASRGTRAGASSTLDRPQRIPQRVQPEPQRDPVDREHASVAPPERHPGLDTADSRLTEQLTLGNRLRAQLQQVIADAIPNGTVQLIPEIDSWIATTRVLLDERSPHLAHYFATDALDLAEPNWPSKLEDAINLSQSGRLNRHLERLNEILSPSS